MYREHRRHWHHYGPRYFLNVEEEVEMLEKAKESWSHFPRNEINPIMPADAKNEHASALREVRSLKNPAYWNTYSMNVLLTCVDLSRSHSGNRNTEQSNITRARQPMIPKTAFQPNLSPIQAPNGTPSIKAAKYDEKMAPIAQPRLL